MGKKKWKSTCRRNDRNVEYLVQHQALSRPIAQYITARGINPDGIDSFLNPRLRALSDPYRFPRIVQAAARLWEAISKQEPILVHGDYDTDGVTATAILASVLRQNGALVTSFIPHRFNDGYGFTPESLEKAIKTVDGECKLLVTVDCGVTSCEAVSKALAVGIDTIITDHHDAGRELPKALAIINPKLYPELEDLHILSGAGVAFKLCHAFIKYGRKNNLGGFTTKLEEILDYVALGTVADIVPLLGENRIMVKYGMETLERQLRPGIRALFETGKIKTPVTPADITFRMAPRINAAGRVGDATIALQLLEATNIIEAYRFSSQLEDYNLTRQQTEQQIYREALEQIESSINLEERYLLLVAGHDWHQGVTGIVASRLARDFNRPALVLTIQNGDACGSGRSVGTVNLVNGLQHNSFLLTRFGGHPMAVGVGLKAKNLQLFYDGMEKYIQQQTPEIELSEVISYDGESELPEFNDVFFHQVNRLAPFGHSNPRPMYRFNDLELIQKMSAGAKHTRGIFRDRNHNQIDFIAFNQMFEQPEKTLLDVVATPQFNTYANINRPQLQVVDVRDSC